MNLCSLCYNYDALRPADSFHSFHSIGALRGHVNRAHSSATTTLSPVYCPYAECETMPEQGEHLGDHLATVHSLNLQCFLLFLSASNTVSSEGAVMLRCERKWGNGERIDEREELKSCG